MERKYIMIDSTYRDRLLYPNPAEFILPINNSIGNSSFNSKNPILAGYPIHNFSFLDSTGSFTGNVVGGNPRAIQVDPTIDNLAGLNVAGFGTGLEEATDIFTNLIITVAGDTNNYRVVSYDPVRRIIYLDTPLINFPALPFAYTISNPSTNTSILLQGYNLSFFGYKPNQDGYFLSPNSLIYVWDMTINEIRSGTLSNFNVNLTEPFGGAWSVDDRYAISLDKPSLDNGQIAAFYSSGLWRFEILHGGSGYTQTCQDVYIIEQGESRPVSEWAVGRICLRGPNDSISRVELLFCGNNYKISANYYLVPVGSPFSLSYARVRVLSTAPAFKIQSLQNASKSRLLGQYFMPLLLTPEFCIDPSNSTLIQLDPNNTLPFIPNRTPSSSSSLLDGYTANGVSPIIDVFEYQNDVYVLTQSFDPSLYKRFDCTNLGVFPETAFYQVLPFSRDGCVSLDYRGSTVSSNQMVCYSLTVNTLILPNQILNLPFGALTSSYPYVLLEITNETASSGHNKSVIYSNNPNTVNATFVCSISDVNSPIITKFININSDKSSQIIKFKPNDNLRFRISMPDGRTFETEQKDYLPPLAPNPLLQINCLIEIARM